MKGKQNVNDGNIILVDSSWPPRVCVQDGEEKSFIRRSVIGIVNDLIDGKCKYLWRLPYELYTLG